MFEWLLKAKKWALYQLKPLLYLLLLVYFEIFYNLYMTLLLHENLL